MRKLITILILLPATLWAHPGPDALHNVMHGLELLYPWPLAVVLLFCVGLVRLKRSAWFPRMTGQRSGTAGEQ